MTEEKGIVTVQPGQIARQELGRQEIERTAETGTAALVAAAEAEVKAKFTLAKLHPRDLDEVRVNLLKECRRPRFAEIARYNKPIGRGVQGFSIHFARAAQRCMGHLDDRPQVIWEDPQKRVSRCSATDWQNNVSHYRDVVVEKTVERSRRRDGQVALSVRTNSKGESTYTVAATEEEAMGKQFNWESRALRNCIMAHIPGDLLDEALDVIEETKRSAAKEDPDGTRKRVADGFANLGIMPADLKAYLGHDLASCTPAELTKLREVWNTLRQGEATWKEFMDAKHGKAENGEQKNGLGGVTDRLKQQAEAGKKAGADDARWTRVLGRVKELTGDDEDAYRSLLGEVSTVYNAAGKGVEGCLEAEKLLITHPIFGDHEPTPPEKPKGAKKKGQKRPPLEE